MACSTKFSIKLFRGKLLTFPSAAVTLKNCFFLVILIVFFSCNPARRLTEGSYLLTKTDIRSDNKKVSQEELNSIIKQQPNRKILGVMRFHLRIYNFASRGKDWKLKQWIRSAGEEPVILDSSLTAKSSLQLNLYLKNKGYFNSLVRDTTIFHDNKTAHVFYFVNTGLPYTVNRITFSISDSKLLDAVKIANVKTLIQPGSNYDTDVFAEERERVSKAMKNQGYYNFSKEYIFFQMDSAHGDYRVDVKQIIKNPFTKTKVEGNDSLIEAKHQIYRINKIYINSNYDPQKKILPSEDTLMRDEYVFLGASGLQFRPEVLLKSIFIKRGDKYSLETVEYTHNRLAALKTFKFISIRFEDAGVVDSLHYLDCFILLSPAPRQSMTFETEGTHRSGNLGIAGEMVYRNKNFFKGAEVLELKFRGGLEAQRLVFDTTKEGTVLGDELGKDVENVVPFNTFEISPEATLFFPNLLLPFGIGKILRPDNPKTNIISLYNYQQRPDYSRHIFNGSFGYSLKSSIYNSHAFFPFDISIVNITNISAAFDSVLNSRENPLLKTSFTDHLISASRYVYTFSNQRGKYSNFMFFRGSAELAGNTLRFINTSLDTVPGEKGAYYLFNDRNDTTGKIIPNSGIRYAHYWKTDFDLRFYNIINKHSNAVYRIFFGIGQGLKNFNVLPFEKSYFGGGANGIRAWTARSLGPGSSPTIKGLTVDKIGDIKLEGNIEYRFDLFKIIDGAFFVDAGNVWLMKKDTTRPGAEFNFERFYDDVALGAGIGARLDFDFFIIRFDTGIKVKDPSGPLDEENGWVIKYIADRRWKSAYEEKYKRKYPFLVYNLGIGYPF